MSSWLPGQALAGGHPQLLDDQVQPGHLLGHRVLDLDPRVHLEEVEAAGGVHQELERPRVGVADRPRARHGRLGEAALDRRRRVPAPATPRSASGGAAGSSTRARAGARRRRGRRRRPAPRRGAAARGSAPGRAPRCRTPTGPAAWRSRTPPPGRPAAPRAPCRCRRRRRPP